MNTTNALGEYLRARRGLVRPAAEVSSDRRRRVEGLRRQEVARLAGVSTDYYIRLEQGRERHPSAQVVEALGRTLRLDGEGLAHLHRLAHPVHTHPDPGDRVSPVLLRMMDTWTFTPAVILDRYLTVVADNQLGRALFAGHRYSRDLVRLVFLDPDAHEFYPEWDRVAANTVGGLRAAVGVDDADPRLVETVGELSLRSEAFSRLWARHDLRQKTHETKRFHHPAVGELVLSYEALTVNSAPGQQLVVYHAEPDSQSERSLSLLGSLTA